MSLVYTTLEKVREFVSFKKRTYQLTFRTPAGKIVLRDLARFCRAGESCYKNDARHHAVLEGRREVWLRIQRFLNLDEAELAEIVSRKPGE